jgi:predicted flap endonuclease-1-like 5' DNA nuclease
MLYDDIKIKKENVQMPTITDIEGIGEAYAVKLRQAGVNTTESLLQKGGTSKGRSDLAKATGLSTKMILEWVNRADLYRVSGIGAQYADLLEAAGVDTVPELASRKPEALLEALAKANKKKNLVNLMPGLSRVQSWIKSAKSLKRAVEY